MIPSRPLPRALLMTCMLVLITMTHGTAIACNERTMLDFIGSLEAPEGYDTVYYGTRIKPPRPITTMSVGEVLDWQRRTVRGGSVSSAAGRYQIIRPTLAGLVDKGVVSPNAPFDEATQNRLGLTLLRETGYRPGDTSPATANRIAGVWAALPRIGGPDEGSSIYEGVAGNHALVKAGTYRGVLECRLDVDDTQTEVAAIRTGERFGVQWDTFLEEIADAAIRAARGLVTTATGVLLLLFTVDLVWRGGRWIVAGDRMNLMFGALLFRLLSVIICLTVIIKGGAIIAHIADLAGQVAGEAGRSAPFALTHFASSKMALVFSLFEGAGSDPWEVQMLLVIFAIVIVLLAALQMAVVIFFYVRLFLVAAAGIPVLGLGGMTQGMPAARSWMLSVLAWGLGLMTLMLILETTQALVWNVRSVNDPVTSGPVLVFMELLALTLLFLLPKTATGIIQKRAR